MDKSRVATWVVAGALALGSGMALAETAPEDPLVVGEETTTTVAEPTTTTVVEPTTTTVAEPDTDADEGEGATHEHPDNHGKAVSEAARDHSHDEEAGNHGKYVSGVARDKADSSSKAKGKSAKPADDDADSD